MPSVDTLSTTFAALADPTRRAILARLALGDASVGELAEPFEISLPAVSRHLKVLESARLIVREKDAQWRRCHLDAAPLKQAADWVEQYRQFWEERFDALDAFLRQETPETVEATDGKKRRRGKGSTRRRR
ncbi:MAG: ArsR/SmtB family transcription factor [Candidatus Eiseniibacteriota bacterium]